MQGRVICERDKVNGNKILTKLVFLFIDKKLVLESAFREGK